MKTGQYTTSYTTIIFVILFHIAAIIGIQYFTWKLSLIAVIMWIIAGCFGIAIGFHRYLTHKGFKTYKPIEYLFVFCGMLALQGAHIKWIALHRIHHRYTEKPGLDPHTPKDGFWWSHIGWIFRSKPYYKTTQLLKDQANDLYKQKIHRLCNTLWWLPTTLLGITLFFTHGPLLIAWAICIPVVLGWHFTWAVNSVAHVWGYQNLPTNDSSKNNLLLAIPTFGEGNHSNHHANPTSARHGLLWYEIDISWYIISTLNKLRLIWNVRT